MGFIWWLIFLTLIIHCCVDLTAKYEHVVQSLSNMWFFVVYCTQPCTHEYSKCSECKTITYIGTSTMNTHIPYLVPLPSKDRALRWCPYKPTHWEGGKKKYGTNSLAQNPSSSDHNIVHVGLTTFHIIFLYIFPHLDWMWREGGIFVNYC